MIVSAMTRSCHADPWWCGSRKRSTLEGCLIFTGQAVLITPQRDSDPAQCLKDTTVSDRYSRAMHGDDRFRHCLQNYEKRVEDAGLSRKRSLQTISANVKRTDLTLAA